MYVFVRKDLSTSQQAVQAAHAAIESTKKWPYLVEHPHLVLIGVKNEASLKKAKALAEENGILITPFYEDDIGMTSLATRPIASDTERQIFRKYQLL